MTQELTKEDREAMLRLQERNGRLWLEMMDATELTAAQVAEMRAIYEQVMRILDRYPALGVPESAFVV